MEPFMKVTKSINGEKAGHETEFCLYVQAVLGDRKSSTGKLYTAVLLSRTPKGAPIRGAVYDRNGEKIRDAAGKLIMATTVRDPELPGSAWVNARSFCNTEFDEDGNEVLIPTWTQVYRFDIVS